MSFLGKPKTTLETSKAPASTTMWFLGDNNLGCFRLASDSSASHQWNSSGIVQLFRRKFENSVFIFSNTASIVKNLYVKSQRTNEITNGANF